jgi:hypothetical protein
MSKSALLAERKKKKEINKEIKKKESGNPSLVSCSQFPVPSSQFPVPSSQFPVPSSSSLLPNIT